MDTEVDLTTADRDVLIAFIAQLQATVLEQQRVIERLQRRIAELEGQAKSGSPPRMPGHKPSSGRQPPAQQRLGVKVLSLIATLREEGRLPIRSVQWYLDTVHQLRLSVGAIVSAIHRTAQRAQPAVAQVLDRIRASPVVHADETGWRQSGANGYVWTFNTPTGRYFLRTLLPAAGSGQNSRGPGAKRCFLWSIGQRSLRCLPPL